MCNPEEDSSPELNQADLCLPATSTPRNRFLLLGRHSVFWYFGIAAPAKTEAGRTPCISGQLWFLAGFSAGSGGRGTGRRQR